MLILLLLFAFAYGGRCENMARNELLNCFSQKVDLNHDGNITRAEIPSITKPWFFDICDLNHDGVLNLEDWNHPDACCQTRECIKKVCIICIGKLHYTQ